MNLSGVGFKRMDTVVTRSRLIVAVGGQPKVGKTRFMLSDVPKRNGVAFLDLTGELEGEEMKKLVKKIPDFHHADFVPRKGLEQTEAVRLVKGLASAWDGAIKAGVSTLAVDDGHTLYELVRFAQFGRLEKVRGREYGPVNRWLRERFEKAKLGDTNVLVASPLKEIYVDDKSTGRYKIGGWPETASRANVIVHLAKDVMRKGVDKFSMEIVDCRHNTNAEGEVLEGRLVGFTELAMLVMPKSKPEDWE